MARLFMRDEKNSDYYAICEYIRSVHSFYLSTKQIATLAESCPCPSFYVSDAYIKRLIWEMNTDRHIPSKFPHIRDKHNEIYNRYKLMLSTHKDQLLSWYAMEISLQCAPRFYFDEDYATILYYKLMNKKV